ncbi:FG-GAP-like repeat-containing protein [Flavobacterium mesophilum]|uniref:FG-GAP-like repeat-containing protein n=1 Tax=Flavobacterium mesophilum TaxID=3143495 RepID=UPI0031DFA242
MKKFYIFIFILTSHFLFSQNFTDTKGELQISSSGTATYTLPIATPPSIKNVAPAINLTYNSGVRWGIAGQGWNITSISTISRIATRRDIDGFVDGVDFDDNDKLALDGQRLLIKTGTYWASGSTYETEYKSNTKIELKIEGTTTYFIVTAPDGSRSWYGSVGNGTLQNSISETAWYIVRYEDANGNFINYEYDSTGKIHVRFILFSGNTAAGISNQNKIEFKYNDAKRSERQYIKGNAVDSEYILKSIIVYSNNAAYRTYELTQVADAQLGYERVESIKEINGQGEPANPVSFKYSPSPTDQERKEKTYSNNLDFDKFDVQGDFDGDGRIDFAVKNQLYTNLFNGSSGSAPITMPVSTSSGKSFAATTLTNNKLNQFNTIINAEVDLNSVTFKYFDLIGGAVNQVYAKTVPIPNIVYNDVQCTTGGGGGEEQSRSVAATASANEYPEAVNLNNQYLEGDFNGDGISDVIVMQYHQIDHYGMDGPCTGPHGEALNCNCIQKESTIGNCTENAYFVNLSPNASTILNTNDLAQLTNFNYCKDLEYIDTADFNGDGKTDIIIINKNTKAYRILGIKQLQNAPWNDIEIIGTGILSAYSPTKQILLGDFNGDGKTDIMLPDSEGGEGQTLWQIYFSNLNPIAGTFFKNVSYYIVEYRPDTSKEPVGYATQIHYSNYFAIDINGDGKSDLVRVWRKYYSPSSFFDPKNHNTQWQITGFANNIGNRASRGFDQTYDSGLFDSASPDIPIPIVSNYRYKDSNTDIVLVRGHYNKIEYYQFNKNVETESRLVEVSEANGNIKQNIEYKSMQAIDGGTGNAATDFYSSENAVTYPNVDIIRDYKSYFVSKLTETINGISKYQDFRYRSYIFNFIYGSVGFTRATRSNWYLSSSSTKIWNTQFNDPNLRGTNTIEWNSTDENTVFNSTPTGLLSTRTNEFANNTVGGNQPWNTYQSDINITDPVASNQNFIANNSITASSAVNDNLNVNYQSSQVVLKPGFSVKGTSGSSFRAYSLVPAGTATPTNSSVFNILLTKQTMIDHLADTKIETTFTYDGTVQSTNYFGLETNRITKTFSGTALQGTTIIDSEYDNNASGTGSNYYVGRPKKIKRSTNIYSGDTRTSEDVYTYGGPNLIKAEKKGHNTYAIVEEMSYDEVGNILIKTVSAPGAPTVLPSRTIRDEYETTKRFVVKKTDYQNFVTNFEYTSLGQVKKSTDYMSIVNDFTYDNWGKLLTTTTTNSSLVPIVATNVYTKLSTGGYTLTTTDNLEAKTITEYDVLGRTVKNSTKGFAANSIISKQIVYDALGRIEKESEPYFSTPSLWTSYEYDYLMRPKTITASTQKIQNITYSGLTTTIDDDGKTTKTTMDALGNKIQVEDPGGTIKFTYFANGQLQESDYQGHKVQMGIDGWGNKISMFNSNAGTYSYSYDAYGQLKTETTPNGTTSLTYDSAGRLTEKSIVGTNNNTNSKTTYAYNGLNQMTSNTFADNLESKIITNSYEYDNLKRLSKTTETTPYAVFVKELAFDSLGRLDKETSTATEIASGKKSTRTIKSKYQNGFPWQMVDDVTQQVLWQTNSADERGQLTSASLGNGIAINQSFDPYGYATQFKFDRTGANPGNVMTLTTAFEAKRGNLKNRTNNLFNWNETPGYNGVDQLLTYNNAQGQQETQAYDEKGKITQNSIGTYEYDGTKTYQNTAITLSSNALAYYQNRGTGANSAPKLNLDISYNAFKSPFSIKEKGRDGNYIDNISFTYNDNNHRSAMFYGGPQDNKLLRPSRKYYSADGTMEIKQNITTGDLEFLTYIGGDGYDAPIVSKSNGTVQNYLYLHRDYQGSIMAITDANANIVEKRLFDAWGSILKVQDGNGNLLSGLTVLDRGYTGHEHLQSVGLINMNARLYDPILHRFLQIDNYIQNPEDTQSYNQYGYVLNNPLKYTDPSGNICEGCGGMPGVDGGGGTEFDGKQFWRDTGMKEWWRNNVRMRSIGSGFDWAGQNFKSFGDNISSLFRKSIKSPGTPFSFKGANYTFNASRNLSMTGAGVLSAEAVKWSISFTSPVSATSVGVGALPLFFVGDGRAAHVEDWYFKKFASEGKYMRIAPWADSSEDIVDDIIKRNNSSGYYIHYTSIESAYKISKTKVLLPNKSNKVYVTHALMTPAEAAQILFLNQKTHVNRGNAVIIMKLNNYQQAGLESNGSDVFELYYTGQLRPESIIYSGPNPFGGKR